MLSGLKKFFQSPYNPSITVAEDKKEERFHPRWNLEDFASMRLEFPKGQFLKLRDISYGGVSLAKPDLNALAFSPKEIEGTLYLFERRCPFKARVVHEDNQQIGFQFIHETADVLMFLRSFLEDVRSGSTAGVLHPDMLKESFQKSYTIAIRGDGPFDLYLDYRDGRLESALMTQRNGEVYHELRLNKNVLQTGRAQKEDGPAPRIHTDGQLDREVLQRALQTLAGARAVLHNERPALLAFYIRIEEALSIRT